MLDVPDDIKQIIVSNLDTYNCKKLSIINKEWATWFREIGWYFHIDKRVRDDILPSIDDYINTMKDIINSIKENDTL